jgi:hypothetical protein
MRFTAFSTLTSPNHIRNVLPYVPIHILGWFQFKEFRFNNAKMFTGLRNGRYPSPVHQGKAQGTVIFHAEKDISRIIHLPVTLSR